MKNIFKTLLGAFLIFGLWSCKKDENKVILKGGTPPVLSSTVTGDIPLSNANKDDMAFSLTWTNPEYQFNTGVSSLNVSYNILIDTTANFTNPNLKILSVGSDLSKSFTQGEFNDILLNQLQLTTGVSHKITIKVQAFLSGNAALLSSNVLSFTTTPYAIPPKVTPPASGNLFIVGSAVAGGWNNPVPVPSQQFTKVSPTDYQITIPIIGDGEYKFLSVNGSWDSDKQWSIATEQASGDPSTLNYDLKLNGGNCRAPLVSGNYKIDVDFQRGKVTLTKL
jgi:hypothetical protein